ncbi:MAG: very short patch repair endonuclease [Deltaproteobacteria bacterium RBG_16_71_12]|nr:MAG: very short patch repair endonuclease [Deltaproteobacteria bacterium RBG_16_71_12]
MRGTRYDVVLDKPTSIRLGRIRQSRTAPEQAVAQALRRLDLTYRRRNHGLPGSPDFANRRAAWAAFVHGCYWHRHSGCIKATTPTRNRDFWLAKFDDNRRRDRKAVRVLRKLGFSVVVVWECECADPARLERRLAKLGERRK